MTPELHIDFETFSVCDLRTAGVHKYADHPSTGVHCLAFAFDDEEPGIVTDVAKLDIDVAAHVAGGGPVVAHNAAFEYVLWNKVCVPKYGWPPLALTQLRCTMAQAYAVALPGALERLAPALGISQVKDAAARRVMLQLCKPREDPLLSCPHCRGDGWARGEVCSCTRMWAPADAPAKFQTLYNYCKQDVRVERAVDKRILRLSAFETRVWQLDQKINGVGVAVDLPTVEKAIGMVAKEKARIDAELTLVTRGGVNHTTENARLLRWVQGQGIAVDGMAKADVTELLTDAHLPSDVRRALELRREGAKSSTAKYAAMREGVSSDGRLRGMFQYHGAATGRWAARRVQLHNLPRGRLKPSQIDQCVEHLGNPEWLDLFAGPPMDVASWMLRSMLVAENGRTLIACDYANVEGRVLAWLAGEERKLGVFRDFDTVGGVDAKGKPLRKGPDVYKATYEASFGVPHAQVTEDQRQISKVQELAFGFGGGVGAWRTMEKPYASVLPAFTDDQVQNIKVKWRDAHPAIVRYWYALEEAAIKAVKYSGEVFIAGPTDRQVMYCKKGSFLGCRLPSGRKLWYPYPEIRDVETPWGETKEAVTFMAELPDQYTGKVYPDPAAHGKWQRISTYGGSLAENVTQAVARDLLAEAMVTLDDAGAKIVLHVHDEAVIEVGSESDFSLAKVQALMTRLPRWATGLPLAAAGFVSKRYRKD